VTDIEPVIDWEKKYQEKVTSDIKQRETQRQKLADAQRDLAVAKQTIVTLEAQVKKLTPAGEQLELCQKNRHDEANAAAKALWQSRQINARAKRGVLEDMIGWLQERANHLPPPIPVDVRAALIEETEGDELLNIDQVLEAATNLGMSITPLGAAPEDRDATANRVKSLIFERTDMTDGDADDLAWDVLHLLAAQ